MHTDIGDDNPFGPVEPVTGWRAAPDCGRCNDTGRFRETRCNMTAPNHQLLVIEAHCTCKRGRRMSEVRNAEANGYDHPDGPSPEALAEWAAGI